MFSNLFGLKVKSRLLTPSLCGLIAIFVTQPLPATAQTTLEQVPSEPVASAPLTSSTSPTSQLPTPYTIPVNARFNGIDLSPNGDVILIASGGRDGGALVFADADTLAPLDAITLPPGVLPADPRYDASGSNVIFAGKCAEEIADCSGHEEGWNIYTYNLDTRETVQVTMPNPGFARREPAWGPNGRKLFVGFNESRGGTATISSNAIFEIFADGSTKPIFPRGSYLAKAQAIQNYIGKLTSLSIMSVQEDGIIFKARLAARIKRRPDEDFQHLLDQNGLENDARLAQFADDHIYIIPEEEFGSRTTQNTLFWLTDSKLEIYHEKEQMQGDLPERKWHVGAATAGTDAIWAVPITLDQNFRGRLLKFTDHTVEIVDPLPTGRIPIKGAILDFEEAAGTAFFATWLTDRSIRLYSIEEWQRLTEYQLRPPSPK